LKLVLRPEPEQDILSFEGPVVAVGMRCYLMIMSVRKLSVALDETIAASASKAARSEGVSLSAWLSRAAEHELALERGRAAVAVWEHEHGPLTNEELRDADAVLDRLLGRRPAKRRARRRLRGA
jgi:hypothetical protein